MTRVRLCARCGVNPIAYVGRHCCYDCVPRQRKNPLLCKRCGSDTDYFTNGLCRRCHRQAPLVTSCRDCLAWGITRTHGGVCQACRSWNKRFPAPQPCPSCQRVVPLNARGYCRLCCRQAHFVRTPHHAIDVIAANRHGQQLFIADLFREKRPKTPAAPRSAAWPSQYPVTYRQLTLVDVDRDYTAARPSELVVPVPDLAAALAEVLADHAHRHGWGKGLQTNTRNAIRMLLATQDTPGAPITASAAAAVTTSRGLDNLKSVLEILTKAGMLDDDRPSTLDNYVERQVARLPEPMANEFREWFRVMRDGSMTPPRSRPRDPATIRARIAGTAHALHAWATNSGYCSLREISRDDVIDVLPSEATRHRQTLTALRALFRFLKGRKLVFTNPTTRLRGPQVGNQPLPIDLTPLRDAILSPKPVRAALAALVAFHALRPKDICALALTDLRDGRLHLDGRTILLADPVRTSLTRWLDERTRRWPNTVNPHLFINLHTAVRTCPADPTWVSATIGVSAQAIREDRILHEAITTGDIRRLCDLFGLTVGGAERYTHTIDQSNTTTAHSGS
jgi:integrase